MNSLECRLGDEMNNFDKILSAGSCPPELLREMNLRSGPMTSEFRKFHEDVEKIEVPDCLHSIEIDKLISASQINSYILEQLETLDASIQLQLDLVNGLNYLDRKQDVNMEGSCSEIQEKISDNILGHQPDVNQVPLSGISDFVLKEHDKIESPTEILRNILLGSKIGEHGSISIRIWNSTTPTS